MARRNPDRRSKTLTGTSVLKFIVLGASVILAGLMIVPVYVSCRPITGRAMCISNLKQLGLGMMIYAADHDEKLPHRDSWMDAIAEYNKAIQTYYCPGIVDKMTPISNLYGYAFNSRLSSVGQSKIKEPENVPMLFDSVNLARNASDPFSSLPNPPRKHRNSKGNVVLYADTRAKVLPIKDVKK